MNAPREAHPLDQAALARIAAAVEPHVDETRWLALASELISAGQPAAENPLDPDQPSGREEGIALVVADNPTPGAVSTRGFVYCNRTFDVPPVFSLTVDDAYRVLQAIVGFDPEDAYADDMAPTEAAAWQPASLPPRWRFGVPRADQLLFLDDSLQRRAFAQALRALEALGGTAVELDIARPSSKPAASSSTARWSPNAGGRTGRRSSDIRKRAPGGDAGAGRGARLQRRRRLRRAVPAARIAAQRPDRARARRGPARDADRASLPDLCSAGGRAHGG